MEKQFLISKEQFLSVKAAWKARKEHTPEEIVLYNILRSLDVKRGFTPISDLNKLANGMKEYSAFEQAVWRLKAQLKPVSRIVMKHHPAESEAYNAKKQAARQERINRWSSNFGIELTEELIDKIIGKCNE